ncbi:MULTISPECIES: hypothetical protein [Kocuria]|jgi:hypothetical protein|uniref:hypothetical protein n=1 Tax=Kocuria TaxID=57493 RepID=UPI000D641CA7|nr:hypothetical protein [Kocuria rosea]MCC5784594.1 hypothetical protein [Kocuria sp. CCUG 69068]MCM3487156.1 hypothetical protein [Kocuria rosea]MEB2527885.1 hypothetical protein [Kocuria rosea]MEB2618235.1 hypothetical protein [Kocuria rosea]PWF86389.1 hypothetical protein DEJ37_09495 [Kocuria rosea]
MSAGPGTPGGAGHGPEDEWSRIVSDLEDVRRAGDRHLAGPRDWSPEDAGAEAAGAEGAGEPEDAGDDDAPYSPDPGPVTQGLSGGALLSWTVLVGVPVLLVVLSLLPGSLPWWAIVGGLVAVVGAIGHLLRSLPDDRDELDDGARV